MQVDCLGVSEECLFAGKRKVERVEMHTVVSRCVEIFAPKGMI